MEKRDLGYVFMAYKTMETLFSLGVNVDDEDEVIDSLSRLWHEGLGSFHFTNGSARNVLVHKDFVIKWDRDAAACMDIGGCEREVKKWFQAKREGFDYLLAPITAIYLHNRFFYVMPYITHIGAAQHAFYDLTHFLTEKEYIWVKKNIGDIHSYNWGLKSGKACFVDYAC